MRNSDTLLRGEETGGDLRLCLACWGAGSWRRDEDGTEEKSAKSMRGGVRTGAVCKVGCHRAVAVTEERIKGPETCVRAKVYVLDCFQN